METELSAVPVPTPPDGGRDAAALLGRLQRAPTPLAAAAEELEALGYLVRAVRGAFGDHLYARPLARRHGLPVQLVVAPDLRGVAVVLAALRALDAEQAVPAVPPVVLATSDAALGSPDSTRWLRRVARAAVRAFVLDDALGPTAARAGNGRRPPMEPVARNRLLVGAAVRIGVELGLDVADRGCAPTPSDANTTSAWTATLAGLGATPDARSLGDRSLLLARLLAEPPTTLRTPRALRRRVDRRIAVLGSPANETNVDLVAAWQELGLEAELVTPQTVRPNDVVVGRLDVSATLDGAEGGLLALLRLERGGTRVLNGAFALVRAHDKLLTARALARAGVPHPRTAHLRSARVPPLLEPPLVVKPRFGSWGADVYRCETRADLAACLDTVRTRPWFRRHGVLLQELVPPVGRDLRLLVAGGDVVGAVERIALPGEWRTNISLGGSFRPLTPSSDARRLAVAAAAAIGADLVGVDILPHDGGYSVLELNGAVEFDAGYTLPGRDVFHDAAAALALDRLRAASR